MKKVAGIFALVMVLIALARHAGSHPAPVHPAAAPTATAAGGGGPGLLYALLAGALLAAAIVGLVVARTRHTTRPAAEPAPAAPGGPPAKWAATLGRDGTLKDSRLTDPEQLDGDSEKYTLELVPGKQDTSTVFAASRRIASVFGKPTTEAYPERYPDGREDRVHITVLGRNTLADGRTWEGAGIDPATGCGVIGRFPDGRPVHFRYYTPRNGCEQSIVAGVKGAGKTATLDTIISIGVVSTVPVIPIVLDPQQGQSLPDWRGQVPYAADPDQCMTYLRAYDAGMTARSHHLAQTPWTDTDGYEHPGMAFYDPHLSGLPIMLLVFDEAHLLIRDKRYGEETRHILSNLAKLNRKAGGHLIIASHNLLLEELGSFTMRANLVGGNVICLRTGERMSGGTVGLEADPHLLPRYFADGTPTSGLGYVVGVDARPDAPMRLDHPGNTRRTAVENTVADMDDVFAAAWHRSLDGPGVAAAQVAHHTLTTVPGGDAGAVDAIVAALTARAAPMRTDQIVQATGHTIRAVTTALAALTADGRILRLTDRTYALPGLHAVGRREAVNG